MIQIDITKDSASVWTDQSNVCDDETYAVWYMRTDPCGVDSYFGINDIHLGAVHYYKIWCFRYWYSILTERVRVQ